MNVDSPSSGLGYQSGFGNEFSSEALCTIEIDGKTVMKPHVNRHLKDGLPHLTYSWHTGYSKVLDGIRNSIFILVAMVTGARKGELAAMHFSHVTTDHNGDYWLKITRWKTAASPKHGEEIGRASCRERV